MSQAPDVPSPRGNVSREISDAIVQVTRAATGRGPVRARVVLDTDVVVVLLYESLTKAEQTLVDHGLVDEVLAMRRGFQKVLRTAYTEAVERATGRRVDTFMSTNHTAPDHAAEIFLLGDALNAPPAGD